MWSKGFITFRPWKDDSVTMQRRSEFVRLRREQQNQRRIKRKEVETLRQEEISEYEQLVRGCWNSMEVLPETSDEGASWAVEKLSLQAAPSVVGLQSFTGNTYLFSCYGTVVEFFEKSSMIVTVANLVKCTDSDEVDDDLKVEVGGPLMNFDGNLIGMNYYHSKETPFIPGFIVLKCPCSGSNYSGAWDVNARLLHALSGQHSYHFIEQALLPWKVVRPRHGLRVRTLYAEGCIALEKRQTNFGGATGVVIEKIEEHSSAEVSGLNEGDIINLLMLGGILLDMGTTYLLDDANFSQSDDSTKMAMCIKFGVRGHEHERTIAVDTPTSSGLNRWPFSKPIIVRNNVDWRLEDEEWYAVESPRESSPASSSKDDDDDE
ncbi:hypothetical protein BAE44_0011431 [Dichanthelium oligosanthes]|uniref:Uncharacterized protein n=1 Tax=Dichanthelium oligosanthes TaxID=888268 RepID=A0A1E5VQZ9_9POAL|nr:hypothetical protein BAE44_0011431 [Dichanthelium oligosanthes]